jgi:tetratricopeptide (TPR) repeat protein
MISKYTKLLIACTLVPVLLATTYARNGAWRGSLLWEDAVTKSPRKSRAYHNLIYAYLKEGRYQKAISICERADVLIQTDHESYYTHYNCGLAFEKTGRTDKALQDYSTAISLNATFYPAFNNRGVLLGRAGLFESALDDLNRSISLNPRYATAYNNRGYTYSLMNKPDQAIEDFNKTIENDIDGTIIDVYVDRGKVYLKKGQKDAAIADFSKACNAGVHAACEALQTALSHQ